MAEVAWWNRVRVSEYPTYWCVTCPANGSIVIPRDGRWTFNGNYEFPTFSPSVNEAWGAPGQTHEEMRQSGASGRNHVFITDGKIQYLGDCTHSLAGQTVEIPTLTEAAAKACYGEAGPL